MLCALDRMSVACAWKASCRISKHSGRTRCTGEGRQRAGRGQGSWMGSWRAISRVARGIGKRGGVLRIGGWHWQQGAWVARGDPDLLANELRLHCFKCLAHVQRGWLQKTCRINTGCHSDPLPNAQPGHHPTVKLAHLEPRLSHLFEHLIGYPPLAQQLRLGQPCRADLPLVCKPCSTADPGVARAALVAAVWRAMAGCMPTP
jgi:hypothetical protein